MKRGKLVRTGTMDCPLCGKVHEVEERKEHVLVPYKNEVMSYCEHFFFCENAPEEENEFMTGKMMNENLARARRSLWENA